MTLSRVHPLSTLQLGALLDVWLHWTLQENCLFSLVTPNYLVWMSLISAIIPVEEKENRNGEN
jgi:hypothetical protein